MHLRLPHFLSQRDKKFKIKKKSGKKIFSHAGFFLLQSPVFIEPCCEIFL